jgi:hypothetical protein
LLRQPLAREITAVLVFKALFLTALYYAFFAGPTPPPRAGIFAPAAPGPSEAR